MGKIAYVDQDLCISCGICVTNLPTVFRFNADNKAECYDPNGADEEIIQREAIDQCPVTCICWQ